jgi:hypothetical protein
MRTRKVLVNNSLEWSLDHHRLATHDVRQALLKILPLPLSSLKVTLSYFDMDTLNDTEWDVVIAGTGLPQSLLAL